MGEVIDIFTGKEIPQVSRSQRIGEAVMLNLAAIEIQGTDAPKEEIDLVWEKAIAATMGLDHQERQEAEEQLNELKEGGING